MSYSLQSMLAGSAQDAPIFVIMVVLCHTHPVQGTAAGGPKPLLVWMVGRGSPAAGALLADQTAFEWFIAEGGRWKPPEMQASLMAYGVAHRRETRDCDAM